MTASVALTSSYSQQGAPCAARYSLPDDTHVGLPFMSAHMIGVLKKRGQVDGGGAAIADIRDHDIVLRKPGTQGQKAVRVPAVEYTAVMRRRPRGDDGGASAHKRWLAPRRALLVRRSWVASRRTAALSVKAPGSGVISASVAVV
jgi:hypothetical protein